MNPNSFVEAVFDCSFPLSEFNHKQHLHFTFLCLASRIPSTRIASGIFEFVKGHGAAEHYDAGLTEKAIQLLKDRMDKSKSDNFDHFLLQNPDLLGDFIGALRNFETSATPSKS